jgi:putative ABC transport system substrate-binding protein
MEQISARAARYAIPVMHPSPECVAAGGLISYGVSLVEQYRPVGGLADSHGREACNLPVIQPTKFELAINRKTAKALGLDTPDKLLALADELIE